MVDFSRSKSAHQAAFIIRHAELNNHVKVATAALDFLSAFSNDYATLGDKMSRPDSNRSDYNCNLIEGRVIAVDLDAISCIY